MVMLAESTRQMIRSDQPELRPIDSMSVKGRRDEVVVWAADEDALSRQAS